MALGCDCSFEWDGESEFWYHPNDYSILNSTKRKRCCSCHKLINIGSLVGEFNRYRGAISDVEIKIYGSEEPISIANHYHCESCIDIFFNLTDLNFCVDKNDNMNDVFEEYKKTYLST